MRFQVFVFCTQMVDEDLILMGKRHLAPGQKIGDDLEMKGLGQNFAVHSRINFTKDPSCAVA